MVRDPWLTAHLATNMLHRLWGGTTMLLRTKRGRRTWQGDRGRALCVVFSGGGLAQTLQPKAVQPPPPQAQQSPIPQAQQPTSPQGQPAPPQWVVGCNNSQQDSIVAPANRPRGTGGEACSGKRRLRDLPDTNSPPSSCSFPSAFISPQA